MKTLSHYTLNTGHTRKSPLTEVDTAVLNDLRKLLTCGTHDLKAALGLPEFAGFDVVVPAAEYSFCFTVQFNMLPIVTCGVACDDQSAAEIWPVLEEMYSHFAGSWMGLNPNPMQPPDFPWLVCIILPTAMIDPWSLRALRWIADFERCLAWAWLTTRIN